MNLKQIAYSLKFKHPFGVSGNTRTHTDTVFVKITEGDFCGYGEACLPAYLGETKESTIHFLEIAGKMLKTKNTEIAIEEILNELDGVSTGNNAAKASIDIALCDLYARKAGKPFYAWKGLTHKASMPTSFTIGIDTEEKIVQKLKEAQGYAILKIKAGTGNDKKLIELIRKHSQTPLYIDVNQGWTNKEEALELIEWMHTQQVVLIEQPLPKHMHEEMKWLTARSPLLTVADESVKRLSDLKQMDGAFGGINIKLMKCTGLLEAIKMIEYCRQHQLKILLGCMAESSCGTSAMAQLMAYADYIDLDAPQLYVNDPFRGVGYTNGRVELNDSYGIGAEPKSDLLSD